MSASISAKTQKGFINRNWFTLLLAVVFFFGFFTNARLHGRGYGFGGSLSAVQGNLVLWGDSHDPRNGELFGFEAEFVSLAFGRTPHFYYDHNSFSVAVPLWLLLFFCIVRLVYKERRRKQSGAAKAEAVNTLP